MYDAAVLYKRFRQRRQVWKFGFDPDDVAAFVADYGWRLVEQAGPEYYLQHHPGGTTSGPSDCESELAGVPHLEWTAWTPTTLPDC